MTFRESVVTCLRKYADFKGRASRAEYWWFYLGAGFVFWSGFVAVLILFRRGSGAGIWVFLACWLPFQLPGLAAMARRYHDTGRSAWTLNQFALLLPGDPWPNRYGPPPGEEEPVEQPSAAPVPAAPWWATPTPGTQAAPAAFIPCPGCGKVINREAGRCPYCHIPLGPSS